jgi:hypothetical protein
VQKLKDRDRMNRRKKWEGLCRPFPHAVAYFRLRLLVNAVTRPHPPELMIGEIKKDLSIDGWALDES